MFVQLGIHINGGIYKELPNSVFSERQAMERKHLHEVPRWHQNCPEQLQAARTELHWLLLVKPLLPPALELVWKSTNSLTAAQAQHALGEARARR